MIANVTKMTNKINRMTVSVMNVLRLTVFLAGVGPAPRNDILFLITFLYTKILMFHEFKDSFYA